MRKISAEKIDDIEAGFMSREEMMEGLDTSFVGRNLHLFCEVESTNFTAQGLAGRGAPDGTAVVADFQQVGKGRNGRSWYSPMGRNIYTSVILHPEIPLIDAPKLTLVAAVSLSETLFSFIKDIPNGKVGIKWPNDIMINGKKCAGILTEMRTASGNVDYVIIGIGVNVNMQPGEMPSEIADIASSLYAERGEILSREAVLRELYRNLENWYKRYLAEGFGPVEERWNALSVVNGRHVRVTSGGASMYEEGVALGVNGEGALLIKRDDGSVAEISAGDVVII